jgi:hypothetical protein
VNRSGWGWPSKAVQRNTISASLASIDPEAAWEKTPGHQHPTTNIARCEDAYILLENGHPTEALALGQAALANFETNHPWTTHAACVTADALDALGRAEEAKVLRERYGVAEPEKP